MAKLIKIEHISNRYSRNRKRLASVYDIEVGDNHNYVANSLLVSNSGASSYSNMLQDFSGIFYRFGCSGTFLRNDSKTLDMWGFLSKVLYKYPASQATREGFLTPIDITVHDVDGIKKSNYQTEYSLNYCENDRLLQSIGEIVKQHTETDDQILILVGRKAGGGSAIHQYLAQQGIDSTFISGDDKKPVVKEALLNFNAKKVKILIGSSIIGEGIDIRSTDHLIMAQGGKSEIAITQAVGRLVRLFEGKEVGHLHDFRFVDTKYLEGHLHKRLDIYQRNFDIDEES